MGDWPVLAEDTAEIAVREEDGARSIFTHQRDLFAKMRMSAEDHGSSRSPAESSFAFLSIHPALPRTEFAMLKQSVGLLDPLGQSTLFLQLLISRMPLLSLFLFCTKGDRREEQRTAQEKRTFYKVPTRDIHTGHCITSKATRPSLQEWCEKSGGQSWPPIVVYKKATLLPPRCRGSKLLTFCDEDQSPSLPDPLRKGLFQLVYPWQCLYCCLLRGSSLFGCFPGSCKTSKKLWTFGVEKL